VAWTNFFSSFNLERLSTLVIKSRREKSGTKAYQGNEVIPHALPSRLENESITGLLRVFTMNALLESLEKRTLGLILKILVLIKEAK
jgi:hypothetical protein